VLAIAYQVISGRFSNYQGGVDIGPVAEGGVGAVSTSIGTSAVLALPSLFLTIAVRAESSVLRLAAKVAFALVWMLLFLAGGRSPIGFAVALCFFAARVLGLRFRPGLSAAVVVALPLAFFLVFTYRTALHNSTDQVASVRGLTSLAVDSTQEVVNHGSARQEAMVHFSDNARSRLWYGPQFFAVVDEWMDSGAGFHGTFLDGIIRTLPSWFFESKNRLADEYNIELELLHTGRFPDIDLGPTPWMQWLFELGLAGIAVGGMLYGFVVRWIDRRIAATTSAYESLFWYAMLAGICSPEQVTDGLIINARNVGAVVCCAYVVVLVLRRLMPTQLAVRASQSS
jgi:hypothetical protein